MLIQFFSKVHLKTPHRHVPCVLNLTFDFQGYWNIFHFAIILNIEENVFETEKWDSDCHTDNDGFAGK